MSIVVAILSLLVIVTLLIGPAVASSMALRSAQKRGDSDRVRLIWASGVAAIAVAVALIVAAVGDGTPWVVAIGRTTTRSATDRAFDGIERSLAAGGWAMVSTWLRSMLLSWAAGVPFAYLERRNERVRREAPAKAEERRRRRRRRREEKRRRDRRERGKKAAEARRA